jgi:hypothetical protein
MYHLELRQSFHNLNRFNLEEQDMLALALPWAQERPIEVGERKWSPHEAKLRILEGPHLEVNELAMGRGWRAALRNSEDVTDAVIARIRAEVGGQVRAAPAPEAGPASDPLALGVQLAALLGAEATQLLAAWRQIAARAPGLSPSESLALAEREISTSGSPST